jgi:2-phosphosulfolactate phosphatase
MDLDVILLPTLLPRLSGEETIVVFDVLRATTTIAAALDSGVSEIHVFGSTEAARAGRLPGALLCGEERCLPPEGFDLGNSPGAFQHTAYQGRRVCMSTTNGTRAILAARDAGQMFCGALVNASAVAETIIASKASNVTLLCAGTNGAVAAEDVLGAGAVIQAIRGHSLLQLHSDMAQVAEDLFVHHRNDLVGALRKTAGGRNVMAAGLEGDIEFAARIDSINVVGRVDTEADVPAIRRV